MATSRVVTVQLRANVAGYVTPMRQAATATTRVAQAAQRAAQASVTAVATTAQATTQLASQAAASWQSHVQAGMQATAQSAAQAQSHAAASTQAWTQGISAGAQASTQAVATTSAAAVSGAAAVTQATAGWQAQVSAGARATSTAVAASAATTAASTGVVSRSIGAVTTATSNAARSIAASARTSEEAWTTAGAGMATQGAVLAGGFLLAARGAMAFDKEMSAARSVLLPTASEFEQLRNAAIAAGQSTTFTAAQAAQGITELGRAGISTKDVLGGALDGALDLAAAGQLDLAEAAEVAADAMVMFGLEGKDVTHIADLLSAGANKSSTNVHQMAFALKQAGLLASQTGLSIEETTGALAMFASAGLKGSDAGTSLKVMLQMLNPKSTEAAALMQQLGFSAFDAQGNFIGLSALADEMTSSFGNLTPEARSAAMATIFGTDAVRAAAVMYQQGAEGTRKWITAVDDQGNAARTAAMMTDNLAGDVKRLGGAMEAAFIQGGSGFTDALRSIVQGLTSVINWFNNLPAPLQTMIVLFGVLAGVVTLMAGAFLLAVPRILAMRAAMQTLATTAPAVAASLRGVMLGLGALGAGLAVATTVVSLFGKSKRQATTDVRSFTEAIKADSGAVGTNTRLLAQQELERLGAAKAAARFGIAIGDLVAASTGDAEALQRVNDALGDMSKMDKLIDEMGPWDAVDEIRKVRDGIDEVSEATVDGAAAQQRLEETMGDTGDQAKTTADQLGEQATAAETLKAALDALNGVHITAAERAIAYEASIDDLTKTIGENGKTLDRSTAAGRANETAFADAAKNAAAYAQAVADETGSVETGNAVLQQHVAQLRAVMQQAGFSKAQIDTLITTYLRVPTDIGTDVTVRTGAASGAIAGISSQLANLPSTKTITISVKQAVQKAWDVADRFADGGIRPPRSVTAYAEGDHVAQIARAGDWRVWAEPETGGEAYIPLSPAKRSRSMAILGDVAGRFGQELVPRGRLMSARALAGASAGGGNAAGWGGGFQFSIGNFYAGERSNADVAGELMWAIRARGY